MKKYLLFILLFQATYLHSQVSDWLVGVQNTSSANSIDSDPNGLIYVSGNTANNYFIGGDSISLSGTSIKYGSFPPQFKRSSHTYLAKIDSLADLKWVRFCAGKSVLAGDIKVDGNGDIVSLVYFYDSLHIQSDTIILRTQKSYFNACLIKYTSNGSFIWARVLPSNVYYYWNNIYQESILVSNNNYYIRLDTVDSSGTHIDWIYQYGTNGSLVKVTPSPFAAPFSEVIKDQFNNFYINIGQDNWQGGYVFSDTLLLRLNSNGVPTSALRGSAKGASIHRMQYDGAFIYATGSFPGNSLTVGNKTVYGTIAGRNQFIMKIEPWSNTVLWLNSLSCGTLPPGFAYYGGSSIANIKIIDGEVFLTGLFRQNYCIDGNTYVSQRDSMLTLLCKLDKNGKLMWIKNLESNEDLYTPLLTVHKHNVYMTTTMGFKGDSIYSDIQVAKGGFGFVYKVFDGTNEINGLVYYDSNGNGSPDANDIYIRDQLIYLVGNHYAITNSNGDYSLYTLKGNYSIRCVNPPPYSSPSPLSHSANFTGFNQIDTANNFKIQLDPNINNLRISIIPDNNRFRLLDGATNCILRYKNLGSTTLSDTITFKYLDKLQIDSVSKTPSTSSPGLLKWRFNNLAPFQEDQIFIRFLTDSLTFLDTINYWSAIEPIYIDTIPIDNTDSTSVIALGAYDPNDKQVQPEGTVNTSFCNSGNYFNYTIRFQNTGNDTAFLVRVRDTLPGKIDFKSFEMIGASHDYEIEVVETGVLDFVFENILLPDSSTNLQESQGYIKFRVKTLPGMKHGDFFENRAYIYFDINEPIITNTVRTDISDWASVESHTSKNSSLLIYPNPTSDILYMRFEKVPGKEVDVSIFDLTGRAVLSKQLTRSNSSDLELTTSSINEGIYLLRVRSGNEQFDSKLVIRR